MGAAFIPARDTQAEKKLEFVKKQLGDILAGYISGRGKTKKIEKATDEILDALRGYIMPTKQTGPLGTAVMTDAAAQGKGKPAAR